MFLMVSTVVVLVGALIKPTVDVQVKEGFDVSETHPILFYRDWRISKSDKSVFCKILSLKEDCVSFPFPTISLLSILDPLSKSTKLFTVADIQEDLFCPNSMSKRWFFSFIDKLLEFLSLLSISRGIPEFVNL